MRSWLLREATPAAERKTTGIIRIKWAKSIAAVLTLLSSTAWGATLVWDPDSSPNLAGYHVYQCSQLPCAPSSGNASLLATLGLVTSFNIGTPAITEYYFVTAYDLSNNESGPSNVATFTPTGAPPVIGASPTSLSFTAQQGGSNPTVQTLSISNTGGGTLTWSASDNAAWLTLSPVSGTGNGTVAVNATTGTLAAGSYSGTVTLNASGASSLTVPVTFTVTTAPVPPTIGASPTSFTFTATQGGANPATQTLSIANTGGGTLSWIASDNAAWLSLSPASGTGKGAVTLSASTGSLTAGSHSGTVTVSAPGASSVTVPVTFTVTKAPVPPAIGASPTSLSFTAQQGGSNPTVQTLSISNTGGGTLTWSASDNAAWLTLSPVSGTGNGTVAVNATTGTLAAGSYSGTVTLNASGASSVTVPVTFIVTITPAPPPVTPPKATPPPTPSGLHITSVN